MPAVIPAAKCLTMCDAVVGFEGGLTNLHGLFNSINVVQYPYSLGHFCAFAQLSQGLGTVAVHFEIRAADSEKVLFATSRRRLEFPHRDFLIQLAVEVRGCTFDTPGVYLIELFCDDQWVCDTSLLLR